MTKELSRFDVNACEEREWLASDFYALVSSFVLIAVIAIMVGVGSDVFSGEFEAPAIVAIGP